VVDAIAIEKFSKVGVYYEILQDLRQNFIYVYRFYLFISAKEGTAAKDRLFPVLGPLEARKSTNTSH
jgi:hypothetical protein